jgi:hypothetical protein
VKTRAGGRLRNTGFALTLGKYVLKNSPSWNRRSCRLGKSGTGVSDVTYWNCIMMPAGAKQAPACRIPSLDDCGQEAWSAAGEQEQTEESGRVITSEQTCCRQVPQRASDLNSFYTLTSEKS